MSENTNEPVAEVPGSSANYVAGNDATGSSEVTNSSSKRRVAPWILGIAAVLVAGAGGYGVATVTHDGPLERASIQNPMMDNGQGPSHMGPGQGHHKGHGMGPGQDMGPGQGMGPDGDGMRNMGPHCEDQLGNHAAPDASGNCPTGFTLDEGMNGPGKKGHGPMGDDAQPNSVVSPTPSASTPTS